MKVGILTFSSAYNFGAVMQCYALFQTVKSLGHEVKVIDYEPSYLATKRPKIGLRTFINRKPYNFIKNIKKIHERQVYYDGYKNFEKSYFEITDLVTTNEKLLQICNAFDCIVVGSDQVWNKKYNGDDDAWYGLGGKTEKKLKWITYAASAGDPNFNEEELEILKSRLFRFSAISLRESKLEDIVKKVVPEIYSKTVLDPSLLADPEIYNNWLSPIIEEPYIVTYQARESQYVFDLSKDLAKKLGIKRIIPIDRYQSVVKNGYSFPHYTPSEFISLVKNAKCVVTTSFHGTAFSIIFNTPFYTIKLNDGADERSENLLKQTGLMDRFIEVGCVVDFSLPDFNFANKELGVLRQNSKQFLIENLC